MVVRGTETDHRYIMIDNSCLKCAVQFGVVFLVVLNILTLLLGIGVMVVGIILKTNNGFLDEDILNFLEKVDLGSLTLKELLFIIIGIVIALGVFTILTSVCGGTGAIFKLRVLLIIYVIILILCILLEIAVLAFWINLLTSVNNWLRGQFEDLLKHYNGPTSVDVYSIGWNLIFILFGCCGVMPQSSSYNDFQTLPSSWWSSGSRGSDLIPASCCYDVTKDNYSNYTNTACTQNWTDYHESGCYDAFYDLFVSLAKPAISITALLIIIEGFAIFFSIVITYYETRKKSGQVV